MPKLRVQSFAVSLDGFGAGPDQDVDNPGGVGGIELFDWFFPTRVWKQMHRLDDLESNAGAKALSTSDIRGADDGETGIDNAAAEDGFKNIGAWILGRNMFGPIRGEWPDESWKGWWGDEPPYHTDVYVLTHHARSSLAMKGGTTFHFITDGIESALKQARRSAGDKDIRLGGGVSTIRQYLTAGLIDELHIAVRPIFLGAGEALWSALDLKQLGYVCHKTIAGERATHVYLRKA